MKTLRDMDRGTAMKIHTLATELQRQDTTGQYFLRVDAITAATKLWEKMNCEHCGGAATMYYECVCIEDDGESKCAENRELFI